jgi:hypothetical protein
MPSHHKKNAAMLPRLLDQVRERLRLKHYSIRTEQAYVGWIRRYIIFHGKRHPAEMGKLELEMLLTSLAVQRNVSASTQTQALSALPQRIGWKAATTFARCRNC